MNRLRLKLIGLAVLILAVIVGVWFLQPGESPPAENVENREQPVSKPQANAHKPKTDAQAATERAVLARASEFENGKVAQLARTADSLKTLYRNPGTPEAAKARQSLLKPPAQLAKSAPALRLFLSNKSSRPFV